MANEFLNKYNPAVPRRFLFIITALVWTTIGIVLAMKAWDFASALSFIQLLIYGMSGIIIAGVGYMFGVSKVVLKNIRRIEALPDRACLFAFTAWRGYIMIGLMISIGIILRSSSLPRYFLVIPYLGMGGALLLGSAQYYAMFLRASTPK